MMICKICGKELKNIYGLNNHLRIHGVTSKEYYDEYILEDKDDKYCPYCGKEKVFRQFQYIKTCGSKGCKQKQTVKTNIEKYGVDNPSKTDEIKNRISNYRKELFKDDKIKDEIFNKNKQTNIKKYGVDHYSKTYEFKEKYKKTSIERYGVDNISKLSSTRDKYKKTCVDRYNEEHPMKNNEIKERLKDVIFDKYGVNNYTQTDEYKEKLHIILMEKFIKNVSKNRPDMEFIEFTGKYHYTHRICKWKCKECGEEFEDYAICTANWLHPRCPSCNPIKYSSIENKVYNYLLTIFNDNQIIRCDRQTITPYELDLYIPHINLAIECDGTYWHSDEVLLERCGLTYEDHCEVKHDLCENRNITLLRFSEDEINNEFEKVELTIKKYII